MLIPETEFHDQNQAVQKHGYGYQNDDDDDDDDGDSESPEVDQTSNQSV